MADRPAKKRSLRARLASPFAALPGLMRHATTAVSSLIVLGGVGCLVAFYRPMEDRAAGLTGAPLRVAFNWPLIQTGASDAGSGAAKPRRTTWLDPASREHLEGIALRELSPLPSDHDSLDRTQKALTATGWFDGPVRVRRWADGVVRIAGVWRIPVAVVRGTNAEGVVKDRLVSAKAELLPPSYNEGASGLKVVLNPMLDPPQVGEVWLGGDVQACLSLLEYLRTTRAYDQVMAIDAGSFSSDEQLVIVTDRGTRILWGAAPGEFAPGQAPDDIKRRRLDRLYSDYGRIDAGLACIDLRLMDNIYEVRPPAQPVASSEDTRPRRGR